MPALTNIRHERFCRAYIRTGSRPEAYRKAGFSTTKKGCIWTGSYRTFNNVHVKRRIAELKKQMAIRNKITVDSLVDELDEARVLALASAQPSAAISATVSKAKLVGLMVDRKETGMPGDFAAASETQVLERVRAELGDAAAALLAQALQHAEDTDAELPDEVDPLPIETTHEGSSTPN